MSLSHPWPERPWIPVRLRLKMVREARVSREFERRRIPEAAV